jgi:hypothetical protein
MYKNIVIFFKLKKFIQVHTKFLKSGQMDMVINF